jgi:hypothetical protein
MAVRSRMAPSQSGLSGRDCASPFLAHEIPSHALEKLKV